MSWANLTNDASSLNGIFAIGGLAIDACLGNGVTVKAIKTTIKRADINSDMGLLSGHYNFSILCRKSDFANTKIPVPRTGKFWIDGKPYRVLSIQEDAVGITIRFDLGDILQ